ncbi:MAG: hypothetical protein RL071_4246 [Pseudomonadota bacterium]|jgi:hypothetical protein
MSAVELRAFVDSLPRGDALRDALAPHLVPGAGAVRGAAWVWVEAVEAEGRVSVLSLSGPGLGVLAADLEALDGRCWFDGADLGPALAQAAARLDAAAGFEPLDAVAGRYGVGIDALTAVDGALVLEDGLPEVILGVTVTVRAGG